MTSKERGLYTLATYRTLRVGVCLEMGMWGCAPVAAAVGCRYGRGPSTPSGTFLCGRGRSTPLGTGILSPDAQGVPARGGVHLTAWNVPGRTVQGWVRWWSRDSWEGCLLSGAGRGQGLRSDAVAGEVDSARLPRAVRRPSPPARLRFAPAVRPARPHRAGPRLGIGRRRAGRVSQSD